MVYRPVPWMTKKKGVLSDAEITEQENVADVKDNGLRSMIIKDLGLTEDDTNKDLIEKIVGREKCSNQARQAPWQVQGAPKRSIYSFHSY